MSVLESEFYLIMRYCLGAEIDIYHQTHLLGLNEKLHSLLLRQEYTVMLRQSECNTQNKGR